MRGWTWSAAAVLAVLVIEPSGVKATQDSADRSEVRFRSGVETVGISVTVRDQHNRLVTDLARRLQADHQPQTGRD